ncbi:MAG TPA: chromosome segregation protein SMC, partial [Spirochaetota bacterium]|nr:chromosome segregation protein SMC [Spirochaetota bacterium]
VNFHKIFRRLFDGGKAELNLTNPENVLESGIEILVQPPSKALQNEALLSGGEASMTAIALLFAIFMVKPSPFCLLDEIDAALDGPNVERFKKMLLEFRETTQFLIISHNINTLKVADALYGISMEEDGVSTALSLDVNELEKLKKKYEVT